MKRVLLLALLAFAAACAGDAPPSGAGQTDREPSVRPGANEPFLSEDLEVSEYVQRFEGESREIYRSRKEIVAALRLEPGMRVADVGAGTGLFLPALDEAVGAEGRVFAVDISPKFLAHLRERARAEDLDQVKVVEAREDSVELPAASIDLAFVCDTYHHFEYPKSTLASLHRALRPGGRLVVVDFERTAGVSSQWTLDHVRAGKDVFTVEIEAAGFELEQELEVDGLVENYVLQFRRP
jgi:predicted methyltransferase